MRRAGDRGGRPGEHFAEMRGIRWNRFARPGRSLRVLAVLEGASTRIPRSFRVKAIGDVVKTKVADAQKEMRRVVASTRSPRTGSERVPAIRRLYILSYTRNRPVEKTDRWREAIDTIDGEKKLENAIHSELVVRPDR